MKTLNNTTANSAKDQVKDIKFWGNENTWRLISKASSDAEGWMKSTKAMEIEGVGCLIQVTTQQKGLQQRRYLLTTELAEKYTGEDRPTWEEKIETNWAVAEAVTFVPGVYIKETFDPETNVVIARQISAIGY